MQLKVCLIALALLAGTSSTFAEALGEQERAKLVEKHEQMWAQVSELKKRGQYAAAIKIGTEALKLDVQLYGKQHEEYAISLNQLGSLYFSAGDTRSAITFTQQAVQIKQKTVGEDDPSYVISLSNLAYMYKSAGAYRQALPLYQQTLPLMKKSHGEKHPQYARSLSHLATIFEKLGATKQAVALFEQVARIRRETLGAEHPDLADSLTDVGYLYRKMGAYAKAVPPYQEAMAIRKKARHAKYAISLNNLAATYEDMGAYEKALPLYEQALKVLGENDPFYPQCLNNLAGLHSEMGSYGKAIAMYQRTLEMTRKASGENHRYYAMALNNLASTYQDVGQYAKALPLYEQALKIKQQLPNADPGSIAASLNNLATLHQKMGAYDKALPLLQQTVEIARKVLGEKHPELAASQNNLAALYEDMGEHEKALALFEKSQQINAETLGEQHPRYGATMSSMAGLHYRMNRPAKGLPLARKALQIAQRNLEQVAIARGELQQMSAQHHVRRMYGLFLTLCQATERSPAIALEHTLRWKGAVTARQTLMRQLRNELEASGDDQGRALFFELERTTRSLAAIAMQTPHPQARQRHAQILGHLNARVEGLQRQLSQKSQTFRQRLQQQDNLLAALAEAIPKDGVLVVLTEYWHFMPGRRPREYQERLLAYIIDREQKVQIVQLGDSATAHQLIGLWRHANQLDKPRTGAEQLALQRWQDAWKGKDVSAELRKRLWTPIDAKLNGAGTVLISPDGPVSQLAVAALPGSKPGRFLIEDYAVATIPVPQLLPRLLGKHKKPGEDMLLVGDVDYGANPGAPVELAVARAALREADRATWQPLAKTGVEISAVQDSFKSGHPDGRAVALRKEAATEQAVRQQLGKAAWVHLATHGYFSSSRRPGVNPGLLSGLVLAGANKPVDAGRDDGILTALEVSELNLSKVELAVLSACQTGLGAATRGEGLLGLQRAFQVAGARTVVASLWEVPDEATQQLMGRFYANMWEKKMGRLEALREAQLWMLKQSRSGDDADRGFAATKKPIKSGVRAWGAFVLSGDWR